ncbi:MAG: hypothetical protein WKF50_07185 [Nocardioides sp.]
MALRKAGKTEKTEKADKTDKADKTGKTGSGDTAKKALTSVRLRIAQLVWLVFVVCALFLAIGALLIALDANQKNSLVKFVLDGASAIDLGIFSRKNGIKDFSGSNADVKNALFNWGIGAVVYLIVGRILDRVIRA